MCRGAFIPCYSTSRWIDEAKFGYLSEKDRRLLKHAIIFRCDAFLKAGRRLQSNLGYVERELRSGILTPIAHWSMLEPWTRLWR